LHTVRVFVVVKRERATDGILIFEKAIREG
jgi:hypothetical protein